VRTIVVAPRLAKIPDVECQQPSSMFRLEMWFMKSIRYVRVSLSPTSRLCPRMQAHQPTHDACTHARMHACTHARMHACTRHSNLALIVSQNHVQVEMLASEVPRGSTPVPSLAPPTPRGGDAPPTPRGASSSPLQRMAVGSSEVSTSRRGGDRNE
jgi:hypothetical protein